jgi:hypothetical protein
MEVLNMCDYVNNSNVAEICLDAVCKQAYSKGFEDGCNCPEVLSEAFNAGYASATSDFEDFLAKHMAVVNVIYHENKTVVKFADGSVSVVFYNPAYGYAYDSEKAIMAALLKHMCGNSYIKVLTTFGLNEYFESDVCDCALSKCGCNIYDNSAEFDANADVDTEPIIYTPYGDGISMSDEDRITLEGMPDDIFDREAEAIFTEMGC